MATTARTKTLKVSELDFDQLKGQFKTFLRNQDQFTDYDFEGSGMSVLMDLLAYNTHYNAFYANMLASEMFLDSAVIRGSVVSRAKQLGYTPSSVTGATANLNVTFLSPATSAAGLSEITIPRYTKFVTSLDDRAFTFLTTEPNTATLLDIYNDGSTFLASDVVVKEGYYFTQSYAAAGVTTEKFNIPSANVDMSTVSVSVNSVKFDKSDNYTSVEGTSNVFFTQEGGDGLYQVYFGDGSVGRALASDDIVFIEYLESMMGPGGNGARIFQLGDIFQGPVGLIDGAAVALANGNALYAASGGTSKEPIDSIKHLAPLNFEAQNRSVTLGDYRARILNDVPGVDAVTAWGGEKNNPPEYGKVFVSVKMKDGYVMSSFDKDKIRTTLRKQNVVSVDPIVIDPDYLYVALNIQVMYVPGETTLISSDLKNLVLQTVTNYSSMDLNKFNSYFRSSRLQRLIDTTEISITNSLMDVKLKQEFTPLINSVRSYDIKFSNPIFHPHSDHMSVLVSTLFSYLYGTSLYLDCSLDDVDGTVRIVQTKVDGSKTVITNAGTINYDTGVVHLEDFVPITINDGSTTIKLYVQPRVEDAVPAFNQIVTINPSDVTITMIDDTSLTSTDRPGTPVSVAASRGTYSTTDTGSGSGSSGTGY